jgi:hypothetical protein
VLGLGAQAAEPEQQQEQGGRPRHRLQPRGTVRG